MAGARGVECWFHQKRKYLFLGDYKYWTITECPEINLDVEDYFYNRALLYHDRRNLENLATKEEPR